MEDEEEEDRDLDLSNWESCSKPGWVLTSDYLRANHCQAGWRYSALPSMQYMGSHGVCTGNLHSEPIYSRYLHFPFYNWYLQAWWLTVILTAWKLMQGERKFEVSQGCCSPSSYSPTPSQRSHQEKWWAHACNPEPGRERWEDQKFKPSLS